jgi:hypothetical protein
MEHVEQQEVQAPVVPEISAAELAKIELKLKETKEFVRGAILLGKLFAKEMGDGFQSSDLITVARKIAVEEQFREILWDAVKGVQKIPEEIKNEQMTDLAIHLGSTVLDSLRVQV